MSLSFRGPIGSDRLADFAIARLFHFPKEALSNLKAANCKACGDRIARAVGREVFIGGAPCFLRSGCAERVAGVMSAFTVEQASEEPALQPS